jgi:cysteine desulfurase
MSSQLPVYFDYASTTPIDAEVMDCLILTLKSKKLLGNASSYTHIYGDYARQGIYQACKQVMNALNVTSGNLIWTSGATESNNLAIMGAVKPAKKKLHIITSSIEHVSVLNTCKHLLKTGHEVTFVPPNKHGLIEAQCIAKAIRPNTALISIMHVNNELGTIQDILPISRLASKHGILFHIDAAQSIGKVNFDWSKINVDLISLSSHKIYGPKGVGALYINNRTKKIDLNPMLHGGSQQGGLRPGTLPLHLIVGMGKAYEISKNNQKKELERLCRYRKTLELSFNRIGGITINGSSQYTTPHIINLTFQDIAAELLLAALNQFAFSTGSACNSADKQTPPSHVLRAIGKTPSEINKTIRLSLGRFTTENEINRLIDHIEKVLPVLRS